MCNWVKDMSFVRSFIVMDDYSSIVVKFDVWIVWVVCISFCMNDNSFNYIIFFNCFIRSSLFYRSNDYVIDVSEFMFWIIKYFDS